MILRQNIFKYAYSLRGSYSFKFVAEESYDFELTLYQKWILILILSKGAENFFDYYASYFASNTYC